MAVTEANIGTNTGSAATTVAITVPAGGVPKGAVVCVCVADSSSAAPGGSVADTGVNAYTRIISANNNAATANGFGAIFSATLTTALVSGNSITYTLAVASSNAAISAFYALTITTNGANTNSGTGSSTAPTVTGSAIGGNTFQVGVVSMTGGSGDTFTQDSTNAAWVTPPVRVGLAGGPTIAGGSITNGSPVALTYAPTLGTTHPWADLIATFTVIPTPYVPNLQIAPILAQ